jgi:hypothetical protein
MHGARDARLQRHEARISGCNVACADTRKEAPSKRALRLLTYIACLVQTTIMAVKIRSRNLNVFSDVGVLFEHKQTNKHALYMNGRAEAGGISHRGLTAHSRGRSRAIPCMFCG